MLKGLIMWIVGEGMLLFFLYVFIRNVVRKKMFIFKELQLESDMDEKKFIRNLTISSWICLSIISYLGALLIVSITFLL